MTELLHPWLGQVIAQEFGEVLEWWSVGETNNRGVTQTRKLSFEDDESSLRVRSPCPRIVQIIKFITQDHPVQACLSDSVDRIDATISKTAVESFTNKTKKRLTDGTMGGVIQLQEFEIVATPFGQRPKRLTLFVTKFKILGSCGSSISSVPRAIQDHPQVKPLLDKLQFYKARFFKSKTPSTQLIHNDGPSPASQLLSNSSNNDLPESQTMFATQVPPRKTSYGVGNLTHHTGSRTDTLLDPSDATAEVLAPPPCPTLSNVHGRPRGAVDEGATGSPPSNDQNLPANEKRHKPTTADDLLDLLKQVGQDMNAKSISMIAAPTFPLTSSSIDVPTVPVSAVEQRPPSPTTVEPAESPSQEDLSLSSIRSSKTSTQKNSKSTLAQVTKESNDGSTSLKKRKCISKRDVTIGKEQEDLLSRDDCKANISNDVYTLTVKSAWLPAHPGQREPSAHVPISILRSLNRQANARANLKLPSHNESIQTSSSVTSEKARSSCSQDEDVCSRANSESDALLSASEWPPSPSPRNQLPPDSSLESAGSVPNPDSPARALPHAPVSPRPPQPRTSKYPDPIGVTGKLSTDSPNIQVSPRSGTNASQVDDPTSRSCVSTPVSARSSVAKASGRSSREGSFDSQVQKSSQPIIERSEPYEVHPEPSPVSDSPSVFFADPPTSSMLPSNLLSLSHRDEESSAVYSIPSSPTSDIVMQLPLPLEAGSGTQAFPSTASQSTEPFTQVKRTPYVNGRKHINSPDRCMSQSPPSDPAFPALQPNGVSLGEVDHITQSAPSAMETSSSEAHTNKSNHDNPSMHTLSARNHAEKQNLDSAVVIDLDQEMSNSPRPSCALEENGENLEIKPTATETGEQDQTTAGALIGNHSITGQEAKRKVPEIDILSPNVSKRRRKFKSPKALDAVESSTERPDPKEGAKRYRQDFVASRKIAKFITPPKWSDTTTANAANQAKESQSTLTGLDTAPTTGGPLQTRSSDLEVPISLSAQELSPERLQDRDGDPLSRESNTTDLGSSATHIEHGLLQGDHSPIQENIDLLSVDEVEPGASDNDSHDVTAIDLDEKPVDAMQSKETATEDTRSEGKQNLVYSVEATNSDGAPQSPGSHDFNVAIADEARSKIISPEIENITNEPTNSRSPLRSMPLGTPSKDCLNFQYNHSSNLSPHGYAQRATTESPVLDSNIHGAQVMNPSLITEPRLSHQSQNIFHKFKSAYPTYPGNKKHFVAICGKIRNLFSNNRMEHPSLWDDFIVRHKIEYQQYMQRCAEDVEDPVRYEDFYRTEIEQPLYLKRVVTPKSLGEALSSDQKEGTSGQQSRDGSGTGKPLLGSHEDVIDTARKNPELWEQVVTIDLTGAKQHDDDRSSMEAASVWSTPKRTQPILGKRRVLPWMEAKGMAHQNSRIVQAESSNPSDRERRKDKTASEDFVESRKRQPLGRYTSGLNDPLGTRHSDQSNISPTGPHSRRSDNKTKDANKEDAPGAWWQDDNTPFKSFMRSFKAIRPGNGNSYAQPRTKPKRPDALRKSAQRAREIDFLNWKL